MYSCQLRPLSWESKTNEINGIQLNFSISNTHGSITLNFNDIECVKHLLLCIICFNALICNDN